MKAVNQKFRGWILVGIILAIFLLFAIRLMQLQIVEGDNYLAKAQEGSVQTVTVDAARGEIVDRYGRPLAVNRMGFNIIFDMSYMPRGSVNGIILELTALLTDQNESWNNSLPIQLVDGSYVYKENQTDLITTLQNDLGINSYATAEEAMYWLVDEYDISEELSAADKLTVAGVRWEMTRREYSITTPFTFAEDISIDTVIRIKERSESFPGVEVRETPIREYVAGDIASSIIGLVGPMYKEDYEALVAAGNTDYQMNDTLGKDGLEAAYESYLRGKDGTREVLLDNKGTVLSVEDTEEAVPGNTVVSTIDKDFQDFIQDALADFIQNMAATGSEGAGKEAQAGSAVVIDVETGGILAAANYPTYDLSTFQQDYETLSTDPLHPLYNRAFMGQYAPGSVFKPAVAIAALSEGVQTATSEEYCSGTFNYLDIVLGCMGVHRDVALTEALSESCNIYFYETGLKLGIDKINEYAQKLGLGVPTGVELPEEDGQLDSPAYRESIGQIWNPGYLIQASIGQANVLATPLQLAVYTATIANDGVRYQAHLVDSIKTYNFDETVKEFEPVVVDEITDKAAVEAVQAGMLECAQTGSAHYYFADYPIKVACKTGTPQTGTNVVTNATFIAYAPYDNPKIAVAVVVEKGGAGYLLGPLVRQIFDEYFFGQSSMENAPSYNTLLQ